MPRPLPSELRSGWTNPLLFCDVELLAEPRVLISLHLES